tara:strand:+ start:80 stop:1234 length:1155 start_codon:yes stop_codon:yes gene_type:complete
MEAIWPGSGSAVSGNTPFNLYDNDSDFQSDAPKFASWCAKRLGYPIMAIEMQDSQFYACLEESISEYSSQVNSFNIRENLIHLQGQPTGSSNDVTHKRVTSNFGRSIQLSEQYGTEAGVGGSVQMKSGSIDVVSGQQVYNLQNLWGEVSESGKRMEIRRVYYEASPAVVRYFDPYAGTGAGSYNMLDSFGWGNMTPAVQFMMMPIYADLLRIQAIEFNDHVRKSGHSFELVNNEVRIFPNPQDDYKLWFQYYLKEDKDTPFQDSSGLGIGTVSDSSNIPYQNMEYTNINDVGKQWIRKYGLALSKELLGIIRSKYGSIPIPNAETTLDGDTLRSEASAEKEALISQLREDLEAASRKQMMENDSEEATRLQEKLQKVPLPIFVG